MPSDAIFLDASHPIALLWTADQHHRAAARIAAELKAKPVPLITTRAVLLEIGNALAKPHVRRLAAELLASLDADGRTEIVPVDEALFFRGLELFRNRPDKAWSLTDCISFTVMKERGLTQALTSDQHFEQAGFTALLRK
jgi:predicted nucleic acid-binding protein